jgi:hypothetical protein
LNQQRATPLRPHLVGHLGRTRTLAAEIYGDISAARG